MACSQRGMAVSEDSPSPLAYVSTAILPYSLLTLPVQDRMKVKYNFRENYFGIIVRQYAYYARGNILPKG